jgi:hypothetical protein
MLPKLNPPPEAGAAFLIGAILLFSSIEFYYWELEAKWPWVTLVTGSQDNFHNFHKCFILVTELNAVANFRQLSLKLPPTLM